MISRLWGGSVTTSATTTNSGHEADMQAAPAHVKQARRLGPGVGHAWRLGNVLPPPRRVALGLVAGERLGRHPRVLCQRLNRGVTRAGHQHRRPGAFLRDLAVILIVVFSLAERATPSWPTLHHAPAGDPGLTSSGAVGVNVRYLQPGSGCHRCTAAGVLCAFPCVVDALPEHCLHRRSSSDLLVAAVFRTNRLLRERCSAACQRRRPPGQARRRRGRLQITVVSPTSSSPGRTAGFGLWRPHKIPTSPRPRPAAPTKTPRTERHYSAHGGTAASMALSVLERLSAGRTG